MVADRSEQLQPASDNWTGLEILEGRTLRSGTPAATPIATPAEVVVAVIDSGLDYSHRALASHVWTNAGEVAGDGIDNDGNGFVDDVRGWDFSANDNDVADGFGHGTHVVGIVVDQVQHAFGTAPSAFFGGLGRAVKVLPVKFMDAAGNGSNADALAALNYVIDLKVNHGVNVKVVNNSWRGGGTYSAEFRDAIRRAADAGILYVAAAGNGGPDGIGDDNDATATYPSGYEVSNVVAVAATDGDDLAGFSNFGAASVDLAAPGFQVLSTLPGNKTGKLSGTSMATPHVSAAAALAFALDADATVSDVKNALLDTAQKLATLAGRIATGGRLDVFAVLRQIAPDALKAELRSTETVETVADGTRNGASTRPVQIDRDCLPHGFRFHAERAVVSPEHEVSDAAVVTTAALELFIPAKTLAFTPVEADPRLVDDSASVLA